jgi:hypothetical protein
VGDHVGSQNTEKHTIHYGFCNLHTQQVGMKSIMKEAEAENIRPAPNFRKQKLNSNLLVKLTDYFEQLFDFNVVVALFKVTQQQPHSIGSCVQDASLRQAIFCSGQNKTPRNSTQHTYASDGCFARKCRGMASSD